MAQATRESIRLKFLKIGAQVRLSVRRVALSMMGGISIGFCSSVF